MVKLAAQVTQGLGTEKPKVARGDLLDYQRTLVDLILSVLASGGEPLSFDHGDCHGRWSHRIQVLQSIQLCRVSYHLARTVLDETPPSLYQINLSQESSTDPLYNLDPELELTLCRIRKARKIVVNNSSNSSSVTNSNQFSTDISVSSSSHFAKPG
ncbi:hypothetical protein CR513_37568, partial [Mucuna pruriens]